MKDEDQEVYEPPEFHRDHDLDETGISQVLIERFIHHRLPMLVKIKEEMDEGKQLSAGELEVMTRLVTRANGINRFVHLHPEYTELVGKILSLIDEITAAAVANEADDDTQ